MWMRLQTYNVVSDEQIDICSLSPAPFGLMVEIDVVKEAIAKHLGAKEVSVALSASCLKYFNDRDFESLVACFAVTMVDGQEYKDPYCFLVVWE